MNLSRVWRFSVPYWAPLLACALLAGCGESGASGPSEATIKGNQSTQAAWEKEKQEKGKNAGRGTAKSSSSPAGSMADKYKGSR